MALAPLESTAWAVGVLNIPPNAPSAIPTLATTKNILVKVT